MPIFPVQSSYSQRPAEAVPGMLAEPFSPYNGDSKTARGLIKSGFGVFKAHAAGGAGASVLATGDVYHIPNPGPGADATAIITSITSSASPQTFLGALLNGVVGAAEMQPPRKVTLTLSSHADWDATNAVLVGLSPLGQPQTENLAIPNGGATTLTSTLFYLSVTSLLIPAQSGTGGTATFGVAALPALTIDDYRGVVRYQPCKAGVSTGSIYNYPGIASNSVTANYVDAEPVPTLTLGAIWVYCEEAISDGDPVFVRVAAGAGGSVLGAFRNDADSATCVAVPNAKFKRNSSGAGAAWVRFGY